MKYQDAVEFVESLGKYKKKCSKERIRLLLELCENPQESLRFLVVRGKQTYGAMGCFLASILRCAGYKTGRCFQPVMQNLTEWILLNGKPISQAAFARLTEHVKTVCEAFPQENYGYPGQEEILAVIGLLYFAEKKADYVLTECFGEMAEGWQSVMEACAEQKVSKNCREQFTVECSLIESSPKTEKAFRVRETARAFFLSGEGYENLEIRLPGSTRVQEAILALKVVKEWSDAEIRMDRKAVLKGIAEAEWPGHLQLLDGKPPVILQETDSCNDVRELGTFLQKRYPGKNCVVILGVREGVNAAQLGTELSSFAGQILTTAVPGESESVPSYELAVQIFRSHKQVTATDSPEEASEIARLMAGKDGVIVVCGARRLLGKVASIVNTLEHKRHKTR